MFQSRWDFGLAAQDALALRRAVLVEGMGLAEADVFDRYDEIGAHLYIWDANGPIAAGRIYPQGEATAIGAIVVAPNQGDALFADLVLRVLLDKAQTLAGDPILAKPLAKDIPLYRSFGFELAGYAPDVYSVPINGVRWHSACKET